MSFSLIPTGLAFSETHPADTNQDFRIEITEVTSYGAAWKTGEVWSKEPNPIPINYVTHAGLLWKTGEVYEFDQAIEEAPQWWVSGVGLNRRGANSNRLNQRPGGVVRQSIDLSNERWLEVRSNSREQSAEVEK